jgi:arginase
LGGACAVSVAPFSELARRYGDDLAIIWIDSHPDIGTPASQYPGFHAMAVVALTGHGDSQVQELLPAIVSADRVALVGLHAWAEDDIANVSQWGIRAFSPVDLRETTQPLEDWLTATGCTRVAIHFDVDTMEHGLAERLGLLRSVASDQRKQAEAGSPGPHPQGDPSGERSGSETVHGGGGRPGST